MIAGLERCIHRASAILVALVALTAAALVLFPGVAHAQEEKEEEATSPATPPAQRVVSPGDSLWSISQERLGPDATQQQVALEVRRIHELNRNQLGDDPSMIFPGQRLSLAPLAEEPAAEPVAQTPTVRPSKPPERDATAASEAPQRATPPTPDPAVEPAVPPALPEAEAVPRVRSLSAQAGPEGSYEEGDADRRRLLGVGVLALTLVLGALMAWRLPMRRAVGDAEAWRLHPSYYYGENRYHHHDHLDADLPVEDKPHPEPAPIVGPAKGHEPGRNGAAGFPPKGLAVAYNPSVRRVLRRASGGGGSSAPGRPPRNRPIVRRGPLRRSARSAVVRRHSARRLPAGLARGRMR